jgi:uncharacterized protein YndB with AHSA1/START domain
MNYKAKQTLLGILIANVFVIIVMMITKYMLRFHSNIPAVFIYSEFVILPILMGIISGWFWRNLNLRSWSLIGYACYDILTAILLSFVFMGEGTICLIIVSPLILVFVYVGLVIGRVMFKNNNQQLNVSIISLLITLFIIDGFSKHEYINEVSDTIIINAPPTKVWNNVVAFKKIEQKPTFWLFRIGLPSPMETTVDGYYKGAGRKCIFSNGYTFGEKISTFEPGRNLVFDIIDQPRDPEIMNHLDLLQGQFLLKDNGDGTTTLTGNSWYKLYVFPSWYYDMWAQSIVRNVHIRVMEHIKEISE